MTKGAKIAIGIGSVIVVGVGSYFAYRHFFKPSSSQFNDFVTKMNAMGADTFEGVGATKMKETEKNFKRNLSKKEMARLIELVDTKKVETLEWTNLFAKGSGISPNLLRG